MAYRTVSKEAVNGSDFLLVVVYLWINRKLKDQCSKLKDKQTNLQTNRHSRNYSWDSLTNNLQLLDIYVFVSFFYDISGYI